MALLLIIAVIVLFFAVVVFRGAPYVPVRRREQEAALDLLDVPPGTTVVDLGSGDGAFLLAAAKRGLVVHGYELNPILCGISWLRCWKYRRQVHIHWADFWRVNLPADTKAVYVFLLDRFMKKLDARLSEQTAHRKGTVMLVSYAFRIPGRKIVRQKGPLFLYKY